MMLNNPYETIVSFDNQTPHQIEKFSSSLKPKLKRSKRGCFNCRKRKKKCDEAKPSCSSCSSKCIPCVWPKNSKEKLPKGYKVPKMDKTLEKEKYLVKTFIPVEFGDISVSGTVEEIDENIRKVEEIDQIDQFDQFEQLEKIEKEIEEIEEIEDIQKIEEIKEEHVDQDKNYNNLISVFDRESLNFINDIIITSPTSNKSNESTPEPLDTESSSAIRYDFYTSKSLGQELSITLNIEDNFKIACINGFITSVGPQYTHPLLTTSATFTPFINNNKLMESIASACGCTFLSWTDPSLVELSFEKYHQASKMMYKYLSSNDEALLKTDSIWLCAGWQLLVLCAKNSFYCTARHTNKNLRMCYQTIMKLIQGKSLFNNYKLNNFIGPKDAFDDTNFNDYDKGYFEDIFTEDNLKIEIEHSLMTFEHNQSDNFNIDKQFERMFIESFMYNYSVNILVSSNVDCLPNPFKVFKDFRNVLKTPLFNCEVSWMNNPVCGAAFDSFEMAAKSSYLIRNLDSPMTLKIAKKLYDIANFHPSSMIPVGLRNQPEYQYLKDSVLIGDVIMRASKIVLLKIIDRNLLSSSELIQNEVEIILKKLKQTSSFSKCKIIATWGILVCGSACINKIQRQTVLENATAIGEITHGSYVFTVLKALNIAWGRDNSHYLSGRGIDILLDGDFLSELKL